MRRGTPVGHWLTAAVSLAALALLALWFTRHEAPRPSVGPAPVERAKPVPPTDVAPHASRFEPAALTVPPAPELATLAPADARILRVRVFESMQGVKAADSPVVADVTVSAGLQRADETLDDALATGTTDADGVCRLALPLDAIERERGEGRGHYWVRAELLGYLPREIVQRFPDREREPVEQLCRFTRGAEVRVRVVDAAGDAAPGEALLVKQGSQPTSRDRWSRTAADGSVTLGATLEGPLFVVARGTGERALRESNLPWLTEDPFHAGAGRSEVFEVDWSAPPADVIEVRLTGSGALRGRVVDAHGGPAAGVVLRAELAGASEFGEGMWAPRESWLNARWGEALGTPATGTVTDGEGRFSLGGLRPEAYHVFAGSSRLTAEPVPADGRALCFEVSRPHLVVRVRDGAGQRDAALEVRARHGDRGAPDEFPERPRLVVLGVEPGTPDPGGFRPLDVDEFVVPVQEASEYLVGVLSRDRPWQPERVSVPPGATRVDVTLLLAAPVGSATLELTAVDRTGAPVQGGRRLSFEDLESGLGVVEREAWTSLPNAWPVRFTLPAGRHRVRVGGSLVSSGHHGAYSTPRVGAAEREITLAPGETRSLTLEVGAGARLRVQATGAPDAADRQAAEKWGSDDQTPERRALYLEYWAGVADLDLEEPGRLHTWIECELEAPAPAKYRGTVDRAFGVPLGESVLTNVLPAGRYTLVGTLVGGRRVERDIELFDGVTTEVTLDFR